MFLNMDPDAKFIVLHFNKWGSNSPYEFVGPYSNMNEVIECLSRVHEAAYDHRHTTYDSIEIHDLSISVTDGKSFIDLLNGHNRNSIYSADLSAYGDIAKRHTKKPPPGFYESGGMSYNSVSKRDALGYFIRELAKELKSKLV